MLALPLLNRWHFVRVRIQRRQHTSPLGQAGRDTDLKRNCFLAAISRRRTKKVSTGRFGRLAVAWSASPVFSLSAAKDSQSQPA